MMRRETSAEIDEAAAAWLARLDRAPLTADEQRSLDGWLDGDTRRLGAFARAQAMLSRIDMAPALGTHFDPGLFAAAGDRGDSAEEGPSLSRRRLLAGGGAALAASGIGAAGLALLGRATRYATGRGEMRRIALADGSLVNLNTASQIDVRFTGTERTIWLESGEALFEVAKDAARPFVVLTGQASVRAVGTAFSVRRRATEERVDILVSEGVVEVAHHRNDAPPVRVHANMQVQTGLAASAGIEAQPIAPAAVEHNLSWLQGRITFTGTRLDEAAAEFARYSDDPLIAVAPDKASHTISGAFDANDPVGFSQSVAESYGLKVVRDGAVVRIF